MSPATTLAAARTTRRLASVPKSAGPRLAAAKEHVGPALESARDQLVPALETARDQLRESVLPALSAALDTAMERSEPVRGEALRRGSAAVAALRGQEVRPRRRWPTAVGFLLLGAAFGAAAGWLSRKSSPTAGQPYEPPTPMPGAAERPAASTTGGSYPPA